MPGRAIYFRGTHDASPGRRRAGMRHPLEWSVRFGRISGIPVRLHALFLVYAACQFVHPGVVSGSAGWEPRAILAALGVVGIFFLATLLHELGHVTAATRVGGQVNEILLWPLGGLTTVDYPLRPKYEALVAVAGPAVNVILGVLSASLLLAFGYWPPFRLLSPVEGFDGTSVTGGPVYWLGVFFVANFLITIFNLVPAMPMDGGRVVHALFWSRSSYSAATAQAVQVARVAGAGLVIVGLYLGLTGEALAEAVVLIVAATVFLASEYERERMRNVQEFAAADFTWASQEPVGLDLEESSVTQLPRARRKTWWQRWIDRWQRAMQERARRIREQEEEELDRLLEKVQKYGKESLTSAELRFLKRVSRRYRSRTQS